MNKLFTKIVGATLGFAMAIGVGVAVASNRNVAPVHAAGETTFTTTNSGGFSNNSKTDGGVTVTFGGSPSWQDAHVRVYAGATISFTSSSESITRIVVNHTSTGTYPISWSSNPSGISSATWTGDASSVTLTNTSSKQVRLTSIVVTTVASKTLSSIGVSTAPTKTSYLSGETFDPTGLVISSTWSSGDPDTYAYAGHTSEFTFSPTTSTALTTSNASVTITYGGKSTSQAITVTDPKTPASVSSVGQTTTFTTGDTFAYGGTLTATYTDTTNTTVSPASFKIGDAGINPTSAGTAIVPGTTTLNRADHHGKTVYVLYTENNTTVYTSYVITVNALSSVTFTAGTDVGSTSGNNSPDTVTKLGITMYGSDAAFATAEYRYYASSTLTFTSTIGNMAKIEFTGDSSKTMGNISLSSGGGSVTKSGNDATWTSSSGGTDEVSFSFDAQNRATVVKVTMASNDPLVELAGDSATSVSMMKGDTDTTVKVHVANINSKTWTYTYDEDDQEGLTTSSYISVSAGAAVQDVHTLTITTKAVGSTVLHISVSGTACDSTIPVTVAAKPASMTVTHKDISGGELEVITGQYKQVSFSGEDTDGNPYSIAAEDVTPSAQSGASHVTLSGSRITGASAGDAVVRYTLNALTSVYAEITVHVVDDYIESVGTPTYATGLTDTQGQSPTVSVFTARPGTMHSGTATTVPFENYKFSYEENYASAVYGSVFSYDFSHGSTVDSTHKLQTIYVFCDIGSTACGSYTVTVEQANDPLTAIAFTNVTDNEVDVARGSTFQLEWAYTPENPTDGKEVEFVIDDNDDGIDITVSSIGLISIGASSNLGTAMVIIQSAHDDTIQDYVIVSAVLETMKYVVNETVSWNLVDDISTLSAGDQVILTGVKDEVAYAAGTYPGTGNNVPADTTNTLTVSGTQVTGVVDTMIYTLEEGTEDGSFAFKGSDGNYLYAAGGSNNNYMKTRATINGDASFILNADGTVVAQGSSTHNYMRYNNTSTSNLFSCYGSSSTTGNLVTFYKKSGGNTNYDVTEALFNAIHNNFGAGKTYQWDATCASFNSTNWSTAGSAVTGISGFANYKLNRAVANAGGNEIEQFLAKYDVVIGKFGTTYDFLGRFTSGGIHYNQARVTNVFGGIDNSNVAMIVVIFSMISITAFAGYMILRKKKEQ